MIQTTIEITNREMFGHKIHDSSGKSPYDMTTFRYHIKDSMIKKIENANIKYVLLDVVNHGPVIREIVASSDKKLIGSQF